MSWQIIHDDDVAATEGWCVKNIAKFYVAYATRATAVAKKS